MTVGALKKEDASKLEAAKKDKAKEQFEYILKNINPGDSDAKTELENLNL